MDFTVVVCTSVHLSFLVDRGLNVCVYRSCGFILLDIAFYFLPRATPNPLLLLYVFPSLRMCF